MSSDPIRILTILGSLGAFLLSVRHIIKRDGFLPRHIFVGTWVFHVLVFYSVYYFSGRWGGVFAPLQSWWPPVILAHGTLSLFVLQLWRLLRGIHGS